MQISYDIAKRGKTLGKRGRPKAESVRERITSRLYPEVLQPCRASGPGWQTRMNTALAGWLKNHTPAEL